MGALLGPLAAIGLLATFASNLRPVLWWAVVPGVAAVVLLALGVEDSHDGAHDKARAPIGWRDVGQLGAPFWSAVAVGVAFTMARFSEAFLVLRAADVGLAPAQVPVVMVAMSVVYAVTTVPAGSLSDRIDRRLVLAAGLRALIASDLVLGLWGTVAGTLVGAGIGGLSNGFTQGLFGALVADTAPAHLRGTAFGLFNLATGVALLASSGLAGLLWQAHGPAAAFLAGAAFALLALFGLAAAIRRIGRR